MFVQSPLNFFFLMLLPFNAVVYVSRIGMWNKNHGFEKHSIWRYEVTLHISTIWFQKNVTKSSYVKPQNKLEAFQHYLRVFLKHGGREAVCEFMSGCWSSSVLE